jgi:elongation factor P
MTFFILTSHFLTHNTHMAAVPSTNLRKGMAIRVNGDLGLILDLQHRTPGNLSGFVQVIMRSFSSGRSKDMRFSASERVEVVETDRQKLEFSYKDNSGINFMNPETYETIALSEALLAEGKDWLVENMPVEVLFIEGKPISVELPPTVDVEVTSAPEGLKGDTANNPSKPAEVSTGQTVQVPLFIKTGDVVRVDTRTGKYMERVSR